MMVKLGLFGGTFDPVHNAHLFVAEAARVELELDRIIFVPSRGVHYRNPPRAPLDDRLAMLRGAIASNAHFALDETDLDDAATGYTADLLPRLRARYPDAELTFIAGGDSLVESPGQLVDAVLQSLAGVAPAPRADREPERLGALIAGLPDAGRRKVRVLDLPALNGSATLVRRQLARGGSIRYLVPEAVDRYIAERRLYAD
jgi:nicotinate-nucleotide adenylyltransferase